MNDDFRVLERQFVKENFTSDNYVKSRMARDVHLVNYDDSFDCIESKRAHYARILEVRANKARSQNDTDLARLLDESASLLGLFSLDGPLATRIMTEFNRRVARFSKEGFEGYYSPFAERAIDSFPDGTKRSVVVKAFCEISGLLDNGGSINQARELLHNIEYRKNRSFTLGRPEEALSLKFERAVKHYIVQNPKHGASRIANHIISQKKSLFGSRLSDQDVRRKVVNFLNQKGLRDPLKRHEFSVDHQE